MARVPLGDIGQRSDALSLHPDPRPGRQRAAHGRELRELGMSVQWNTELVGLEQDARSRSKATLKQPDGTTREVAAAWVAGCDGAHSAVRELNGIAFPGAPYEHVFFVADVEATGSMVPDELNVYLWRDGFHLFFPMRGKDHWRIVGILPPELRGRDGSDVRRRDAVDARGGGRRACRSRRARWFSTYRIHHRARRALPRTAAASCSATRRTSTARSARRA